MERINKYIKYGCYFGIGIFLILKFVLKMSDTLDAVSYSVSATTIVSALYVTYLWKYNPFEKYPRLNNNYSGVLRTEKFGERNVEVKITHNLLYTHIKLSSDESKSKSNSFNIYKDGEDWVLVYTYINEPNILEREHSDIHYGTCILEIASEDELRGKYYTDRKTVGEIILKKVKNK